MRRVLVDYARARGCAKREGAARRIAFDDNLLLSAEPDPMVVRLDEALEKLAGFDSRKAHIVEMRYFGGLTAEEIAAVAHFTANRTPRLESGQIVAGPRNEQSHGCANGYGNSCTT